MSLNFLKTYLPLSPCHKRVAAFHREHVTIPNPQVFLSKIRRLKSNHSKPSYQDSSGREKEERTLQVITDFDYTLTKHNNPYSSSGHQHCDALFGAFVRSPYLPDLFKEQLVKNYLMQIDIKNRFGPYETDSSISFEERMSLIDELYRIQLDLFKKHRITLKMVDAVTRDSQIVFRAFTEELIRELAYEQVPLYIISGGISDMIYSMMKGVFLNKGKMSPFSQKVLQNISIHSNELQLWSPRKSDPQLPILQQTVKFKKPCIHSFNKYKIMASLPIRNYQDDKTPLVPNTSLPDCILLGDLISDIYMSRAHPHSTILSIFYAKEGEFDQRALAQKKYDVVIESDGSHRIVLQLIKIIKGQKERVNWSYINEMNPQIQELIRWV